MTYIQNKERPIFLSFLNREAADAAGTRRTWKDDLKNLDIVTITHCSTLTVNISQMLEYTLGRPELVEPLVELSKSKILITTSNDKSHSEFIASRQLMYEKVAARYPIYFTDTSLAERFEIRQKNEFSMSRVLRRDLMSITDTNFAMLEFWGSQRHGHTEDWQLVLDHIRQIQEVFGRNTRAAITRLNLEEHLASAQIPEQALSAFARVISARYFDHYKQHKRAVTCTGLGDIGYVDDHDLFPHYDIPILGRALSALAWDRATSTIPEMRAQVYDAYRGRAHLAFVESIQSFLGALSESVQKRSNYPRSEGDFYSSLREQIVTRCRHLVFGITDGKSPSFSSIDEYYEWATRIINDSAEQCRSTDREFANEWEQLMASKDVTRIVLLTATDTEGDAVVDALINAGYSEAGHIRTARGISQRFLHGKYKEVVLARSSAGSVGVSGSQVVADEVIRELEPHHVIAVGICFGMKPDEQAQRNMGIAKIVKGDQSLGDIIYSEKVTDYETVRLTFDDGEENLRERGMRVPAGSVLLDAARLSRGKYSSGNTQVISGEVISGLKLLDSRPAIDELRQRFPDAVGGEMEAVGLVASSLRHGIDWIVVKGICDWGMNKGKKEQRLAADNAAGFVMKMMEIIHSAKR